MAYHIHDNCYDNSGSDNDCNHYHDATNDYNDDNICDNDKFNLCSHHMNLFWTYGWKTC